VVFHELVKVFVETGDANVVIADPGVWGRFEADELMGAQGGSADRAGVCAFKTRGIR